MTKHYDRSYVGQMSRRAEAQLGEAGKAVTDLRDELDQLARHLARQGIGASLASVGGLVRRAADVEARMLRLAGYWEAMQEHAAFTGAGLDPRTGEAVASAPAGATGAAGPQ